ncbi:MAG: type II toxin-antitoxin system antitoxin SocA domain-containing protein [Gaiellaceae bacterium]
MAREESFDEQKFRELIVYLARRLEPHAALGRVKLAKLLMYCDFASFARRGKTMTGATYEKWEHGHLPRELLLVERDLQSEGAITIEPVNYFGRTLKHITAGRDPDLSNFDEDDIAIVETAIRLYGYESASYLRQLAHYEPGWRLAEDHEAIPPFTVFLPKVGPSEGDVRRGEELASLHGW